MWLCEIIPCEFASFRVSYVMWSNLQTRTLPHIQYAEWRQISIRMCVVMEVSMRLLCIQNGFWPDSKASIHKARRIHMNLIREWVHSSNQLALWTGSACTLCSYATLRWENGSDMRFSTLSRERRLKIRVSTIEFRYPPHVSRPSYAIVHESNVSYVKTSDLNRFTQLKCSKELIVSWMTCITGASSSECVENRSTFFIQSINSTALKMILWIPFHDILMLAR